MRAGRRRGVKRKGVQPSPSHRRRRGLGRDSGRLRKWWNCLFAGQPARTRTCHRPAIPTSFCLPPARAGWRLSGAIGRGPRPPGAARLGPLPRCPCFGQRPACPAHDNQPVPGPRSTAAVPRHSVLGLSRLASLSQRPHSRAAGARSPGEDFGPGGGKHESIMEWRRGRAFPEGESFLALPIRRRRVNPRCQALDNTPGMFSHPAGAAIGQVPRRMWFGSSGRAASHEPAARARAALPWRRGLARSG